MPRFKTVHQGLKLLPVDFDKQVQSGSFEHALCYLIDQELDVTTLRSRYRNDQQGAPAYDPAVLLKIVRLAYSRGIVGSRKIEGACRDNILFRAVSGDAQPHFTPLADFISTLGEEAAKRFAQGLTICGKQGLIGRERFAIDGVKLPSNASKAKSGKRADYARELGKMEQAAVRMLAQHRDADAQREAPPERDVKKLERLPREADKLKAWLAAHAEDKKSAKGNVRLSHRTDNESAKRATGKGVIPGYTGVAAVDEQHPIIVEAQAQAQAHGTGAEQERLIPIIEATTLLRPPATVITADAGYPFEDNLKALADNPVEAYICDNGYRQRDERDAGQEIHPEKPEPLGDKGGKVAKMKRFGPPTSGSPRTPRLAVARRAGGFIPTARTAPSMATPR